MNFENRYWKAIVEQSRTFDFFKLLVWESSGTKVSHSLTNWVVVLVCDPILSVTRLFSDYQRKVAVIISSKWFVAIIRTCIKVLIEVSIQYFFDAWRQIYNFVTHYYSVNCYYLPNIVFTHDRKMFSTKFWNKLNQSLPNDHFLQFI